MVVCKAAACNKPVGTLADDSIFSCQKARWYTAEVQPSLMQPAPAALLIPACMPAPAEGQCCHCGLCSTAMCRHSLHSLICGNTGYARLAH